MGGLAKGRVVSVCICSPIGAAEDGALAVSDRLTRQPLVGSEVCLQAPWLITDDRLRGGPHRDRRRGASMAVAENVRRPLNAPVSTTPRRPMIVPILAA